MLYIINLTALFKFWRVIMLMIKDISTREVKKPKSNMTGHIGLSQ